MTTFRYRWTPCLSALVLSACSTDSAPVTQEAAPDVTDETVDAAADTASNPSDAASEAETQGHLDAGGDDVATSPDTSPPDDTVDDPDGESPDAESGIDANVLDVDANLPDAPDGVPFVLDCDAYCGLMAEVCQGEQAQYTSSVACQTACQSFSLGPPGDATGNTLTCRYGRALLAEKNAAEQNTADAAALCVEAGPTGGDGCGSVCAGFCTLAQELCVATWVGLDCEGVCSTFPEGSATCRADAAIAGDCASTSVTPGGACEAPLPSGDTCGNALTVGSLPFTGVGDTTGSADDYGYVGGLCGGEFGGSGGAGAPDQVWTYAASSPETLRIELRAKGDYDSILYVTTGCDDISAQCLDKKDSVGFQPAEIIEVAVTAGQTLYIVIDASGPSAAEVGAYELKVSSL
ncbi:MAG: hypothetical protein IV100_03390 [Myxococcales bacterium]|nr:hypothetical protein [Myxococcales bacterium]